MFTPKTEKARSNSTADSAKSHPQHRSSLAHLHPASKMSAPRQVGGELAQGGRAEREESDQRTDPSSIPVFSPGEAIQSGHLAAITELPLPVGVQAKLAVRQTYDPLEREADLISDYVLRMPDTRQGSSADQAPLGSERPNNSRAAQANHDAIPETRFQESSGVVHGALRSSGRPLQPEDRAFFESRFGQDFRHVQIHADTEAAQSARAFGALAFTVGSRIVFGPGQYQPGTSQGRKLLAHELTHVVQQTGGVASLRSDRAAELSPNHAAQAQRPVSSAGGPLIQRFESYEHVQLGDTSGGAATGYILLEAHTRDLPQHAAPVSTWPAAWQTYYATLNPDQQRALTRGLTYGEVVALSGDMYGSFEALNRAPLREIIDLIPLIRSRTATTEQFQSATGGRYLSLAKENIGHFSNVPVGQRNRDVWRSNHVQAIAAARSGNANMAWAINAAGDHFLTDAFSGGHLRTARATLHAQGAVGDIQSKILHDLDNQHGVDVTNDRGDSWTAYGDSHLNDSADTRNLAIAQEAVRLSKQDISDALSQRMAYPVPTSTTVFAAESLIPHPVSLTTDRWTGRQSSPLVPGNPFGATSDYQRERRSLVASEAPGIASELTNDDDRVRAWINRMDVAALGRQSEADKARMIRVLLSGVVDPTDMDAIERLLGSVTDATEMAHLRAIFRPQALNLNDLGLRMRLRIALDRTP